MELFYVLRPVLIAAITASVPWRIISLYLFAEQVALNLNDS
jgi:hypothetical protein